MVGANVFLDFTLGITRFKIAVNYCRKTASEVDQLLKRIAAQAQRQFSAAATAGNYGQQEDTDISADNR